ncbi:hypothetical protein FRC19_006273 [Serendipita sp. 401]|nr:hypothetical protein FRC19_006273 [Serendipita sp. 401]
MPRFIRRLAAFLKADVAGEIKYRQRKRVIQPKKQPLKERPPIVPNKNRRRSFLLDTNPIMNKKEYSIPRKPPPAIVSQSRTDENLQGKRLMSPIEMDVAASPYGLQRECSAAQSVPASSQGLLYQEASSRATGLFNFD